MRTMIIVTAGLLATIGTASAHAILKESTPPDRGSIAPGERTVTMRYNSRIDHARSRLTLDGTNAQMVLPLDQDSPADALVTKVNLTPGSYVVHWQVLAIDGHLTRGDVHFTVTEK
jgi:methionine-rich copper-binding protein CopC